MATINTVVDQIESTAIAMVGLAWFNYGDRSSVNVDRDKGYPRLIVDRNAIVRSWDLQKGQKTVDFIFQFYDLFHRETEAQNNDQEVQGNIELLAQQYFKELESKFKPNNIRIVDSTITNGDFVLPAAQDRTLRLQVRVGILFIGNCSEGVFNYGT